MNAGRPQARYPNAADVHGRVRERRFDVPAFWPPPPDPEDPARYRELPQATKDALDAFISSRVVAQTEPGTDSAAVRSAFQTATGLSVPSGAVIGAMYAAGYGATLSSVNQPGAKRFKAKLI